MCHSISPVVQVSKVGHPKGIVGICAGEVQQQAETLEVLSDVLNRRIPAIQFEFGSKLGLDTQL